MLVFFFFWVLSYIKSFLFPNKKIWKGKHILITGGSSGLGLSLAKLFLEKGANITIISSNKQKLENAQKILEEKKVNKSNKIFSIQADVTDEHQITTAIEKAINNMGIIDVIIPCAGIAQPGLIIDTPNKIYQKQIELNYLGTVYTIKATLPYMINGNNGGDIIIVSSAMGLIGFAGYSQYAPTKWALRGFADCLRNELKKYKINVYIFYPSNMDTPGFKEENKIKPEVTKIIEGSSTLFTPDQAAHHLLDGINKGQYHITSESLIELLRCSVNGISPRNHFILEFLIQPFLPIISSIYLKVIDYLAHSKVKNF